MTSFGLRREALQSVRHWAVEGLCLPRRAAQPFVGVLQWDAERVSIAQAERRPAEMCRDLFRTGRAVDAVTSLVLAAPEVPIERRVVLPSRLQVTGPRDDGVAGARGADRPGEDKAAVALVGQGEAAAGRAARLT